VLNSTVDVAAREFALKLRAAEPIAAFWQAKAHLDTDAQAQSLLAELRERQQDLALKQQNGSVAQGEIDALRSLQGEVRRQPVIMAYLQAQQQAQAFLPQVNREIGQLLGLDFGALAGAGC
jgi:cell fate (sporulation/competence/biofilm development) regulator YlbF (YheA/YmcA/DUF963 family)